MTDSVHERCSTGVAGLDRILGGGLISGRSYLVRGAPGTGKTILGLHFLTAGVDAGETSLFVNLEEAESDVRRNAAALGFDLDGVHFLDLSPSADAFEHDRSYDLLAASDVEREPFVEAVVDAVSELDPDRVFVDPITQLRYLTPDAHQFREQVVGFMRFLRDRGATVYFTSQHTSDTPDDDLQFLSDGTIELRDSEAGHTIDVPKFRGAGVRGGTHSMAIGPGGVTVYPELRPDDHDEAFVSEAISSGVDELDDMLSGGVERGTVTVISGPSGAGKTTLGTQFMTEAATRGERSVLYLFEENGSTFRKRSTAIGMPIERMETAGTLRIREMEPLSLSPQEFAHHVRRDVEECDADVVMIDGVSGYQLAVQGSQTDLLREIHALCRYLQNVGVTVVLVDENSDVVGDFRATDVGISYLADNLVFLRYLEHRGELGKAVGILKKRTSDFERTIREFEITERGIHVGDPLSDLRGVLSGTPEWVGDADDE